MGFLSKFEHKMEDTLEGAAGKMLDAPISPVQIAKKAEKQMKRGKMVGAGKQYAPTLYTVLVNPQDDERLFGYYPTLAGEIETTLAAKANAMGLSMDGQPLVRFIVDDELKSGKFDVIAEAVSAPVISQLRDEEFRRYGLAQQGGMNQAYAAPQQPQPAVQAPAGYGSAAPALENVGYGTADQANYNPYQSAEPAKEPLPYVPEDELDRSINYGEYTFNSQDFESYQQNGAAGAPEAAAAAAGAAAAAAPAATPAAAANTVMLGNGAAGRPRARLVDTTNNRTYMLDGTNQVAGRSESCDIVVPDINASRKHAQFGLNRQGFWIVTDLGSKNGTVVNGQIVPGAALHNGDRITLGLTNFVFNQA